MSNSRSVALLLYISLACKGADAPKPSSETTSSNTWSAAAAARYLDGRATWWQGWSKSQRDHETVCVSCHTMLPYALSRSKLRSSLGEAGLAGPEQTMLQHVRKRVSLWSEVQPYYLDAKSGPGKSKESRSTESVLNALVLAANNADAKRLDPIARKAFDAAWALQIKSGERAGAWDWQVFHLAPWESGESQYQGATLMALAVGLAPGKYSHDPAIQSNLQALRSYLKREYGSQPLLNRIVLLWTSGKLPGLLSKSDRRDLLNQIVEKQQQDGGWSLASLGNWDRSDHTPQEHQSDGYATAIVTLSLQQAEMRHSKPLLAGRNWLECHQDQADGAWHSSSLNKKRDPATDVGKFMTDAATGYAVLALEGTR